MDYHCAMCACGTPCPSRAREQNEPSVFVLSWSDPCTGEHGIEAIYEGTHEAEMAAHEEAERRNLADPSGPDWSVGHWPIRMMPPVVS